MKKPETIDTIEKADDFARDVFSNLNFSDLRIGDLRTEAPTTKTLDKGRYRFVEISGVPSLYYRAVNGTIYKLDMVVA